MSFLDDLKIAVFLAVKSITRSSKITVGLIVTILALAFINLIFISAVLDGFMATMNNQIVNNFTSNIVIDPQEEPVKKEFIPHTAEVRRNIENIPGVVSTSSHYKLYSAISYDKDKNGKPKIVSTQVIGIDPEEEKKMTEVSKSIVAGRYFEGFGDGDILLGADLSGGYGSVSEFNNLGTVNVGDKVKLLFSNGTTRDYTIRGIFRVRDMAIDQFAFITQKEAESILSVHDSASQILVKIEKTGTEDSYIPKIQNLAPNLMIRKWSYYAGMVQDITDSFGLINMIISLIGLAVVAITVFIFIFINVTHRKKQIGILKAIGIKENIIIYAYTMQALFYATSGVALGLFLIYFVLVPYFPVLKLSLGDVRLVINQVGMFYSIISLFVVAIFAGFIPSHQAAKENILKAIWDI